MDLINTSRIEKHFFELLKRQDPTTTIPYFAVCNFPWPGRISPDARIAFNTCGKYHITALAKQPPILKKAWKGLSSNNLIIL